MLLPQIEQRPLFDALNFNLPIEDASNPTSRLARIDGLPLPVRHRATGLVGGDPRLRHGRPVQNICQVAAANYVGMYGTSDPGIDGDGIFFRDSNIGIRDITDGTAQTIAAGERSPCAWARPPGSARSPARPLSRRPTTASAIHGSRAQPGNDPGPRRRQPRAGRSAEAKSTSSTATTPAG